MSNHTPGPWRVAEVDRDGEPGALEVRAGRFPEYLGAVALLYDVNEKQANARFIAAAPLLLEAAQLGASMLTIEARHHRENNRPKMAEAVEGAIKNIQRAIAIAEGT